MSVRDLDITAGRVRAYSPPGKPEGKARPTFHSRLLYGDGMHADPSCIENPRPGEQRSAGSSGTVHITGISMTQLCVHLGMSYREFVVQLKTCPTPTLENPVLTVSDPTGAFDNTAPFVIGADANPVAERYRMQCAFERQRCETCDMAYADNRRLLLNPQNKMGPDDFCA